MALIVQHTRPLWIHWCVNLCGARASLQTTPGFTTAQTERRRAPLRPGTAPPPDGPGGRVGRTPSDQWQYIAYTAPVQPMHDSICVSLQSLCLKYQRTASRAEPSQRARRYVVRGHTCCEGPHLGVGMVVSWLYKIMMCPSQYRLKI